MGKKPTHPKLLDWLAVRFIENGWSLKKLHRQIMMSETYCRSSHHPQMAEVQKRDPEKLAYAVHQPRRLAAEEIRDSMLSVTGEWNPEMGGLPIRPEINLEAALQPRQIMGTYAPAYQPSQLPEQRHRRSIYAVRIRGLRNPFFEVFNRPGPDTSCELRESSTVTPQVFAMFNNQGTQDRALALALRVLRETSKKPDALKRAFQLVYGRPANEDELQACLSHWKEMTARHKQIKLTPKKYPTEVVRHAVEEMNGEPFSFVEKLEAYEDFVADIKPWEVKPEVRLADVCLVLLCSNEFLYVP